MVWDDGPVLRLGGFARINFRARFQEDVRQSYDGAEVTAGLDTFRLTRRRVGIQGRLFDHLDFEIERELVSSELTPDEVAAGGTARTPWKDVFLELDVIEAAQIRAGRFKVPFGLDELTSATSGDFIHRSLGADYLAPARDVGVMLHSRFFRRALGYSAGVFRHDGDNAHSRLSQGGDLTYAVRLTSEPFRRLDGLEFGTAFATTDLGNEKPAPNGLRGRTILTEESFFSALYVSGRRLRWEADLDWAVGPASVRAEYTQVVDDRLGQGLAAQDLPDARYTSWYVSGSYLLTGEDKTRPVRPRTQFLRGGIGAVEVAARYEHIRYGGVAGRDQPLRNPRAETILPNGNRVVTLGVNWVLNQWVTLQVNGIREEIEDEERSPVTGGGAFWNTVLRLQLVL
jgi:phosphate-selective porin OprO/OprP